MFILFNEILFVANTWEVSALFCLRAILQRFFSNWQGSHNLPQRKLCDSVLPGSVACSIAQKDTLSLGWGRDFKGVSGAQRMLPCKGWGSLQRAECFITTSRHKGAAVPSMRARNWLSSSQVGSSFPKLCASPTRFTSRILFSFYERWLWAPAPILGI